MENMGIEYENDVLDKILTDLGLTKYEAMIYRALIKLGEAKALEIAQTSGVPREKTYQVLRELEDKEIVKRIEGKPRKWIAMPPNPIFEDVVNEKKKTLNKIEETIKILQKLYDKGSKRTERKELNIWEIGGSSFEESFYSSLNYAHISIYALLTPLALESITYNIDLFKKLYKKDIDAKIITWIYEDNLHDIAKLNQYINIYIIPGEPVDLSFYIIDDKTGYIIRDGKEYIIQYSDARMAHFITELFNRLLTLSLKADSYIEYWEATETLENSEILHPKENLKIQEKILTDILRDELKNHGDISVIAGAVRKIFQTYISSYNNLHIEEKIQLINTLLKNDALYNNIQITLDISTQTLLIEARLNDDMDWIYEVKKYSIIMPPIPYLVYIHDELRKMGWKHVQTIWLEDKKPNKPFLERKIKIIKKYEKPI